PVHRAADAGNVRPCSNHPFGFRSARPPDEIETSRAESMEIPPASDSQRTRDHDVRPLVQCSPTSNTPFAAHPSDESWPAAVPKRPSVRRANHATKPVSSDNRPVLRALANDRRAKEM